MGTNENMLESWLVMWTQHTRKWDPSTMLTSWTCKLIRKIELIREIFLSSVKMLNQLRGRHVSIMPTPMASILHVLQTLLTEKSSTSNHRYYRWLWCRSSFFLLRGSRKKLCNSFLHVKVKTESVTQPCADGPSVSTALLTCVPHLLMQRNNSSILTRCAILNTCTCSVLFCSSFTTIRTWALISLWSQLVAAAPEFSFPLGDRPVISQQPFFRPSSDTQSL